MTESVKVGSEGKYTIGLIDKDRINYITAMNTERDTYNQSMRVRRLPFSPQLFSTLLAYVSFGFAACNILYVNILHADIELSAPAKTPFRCYLLALL